MQLYKLLSNIKILPSYSFKLLLIAFVGIQIPVLGLAVLLTYNISAELSTAHVLLLTFGLTFLAAALNLLALNQMVVPIKKAKRALLSYLQEGKLPELPMHFQDEVGVLMQSVQQTLISLDQLLQEKKDMVALLSHDIRSPLNTSSSLAELIRIKSDDAEIKTYCEQIQQQNAKQIRLFNMVLELLREDQGENEKLPTEKVNLAELIDEAVSSLSLEIGQKLLEVEKNVPTNIYISIQRTAFAQVLTNLLHNAIKFSPRQGKIQIVSYVRNAEVRISLSDEGIGFAAKDDLHLVFDRFTQVRRKGTEGEPSTGLGLYLSRKIVRRHHGELRAHSEGEHKGSTFSITLPA